MKASLMHDFAEGTSRQLEAAQRIEEAARFLDLEKWIVQRIEHCERELHVTLQLASSSQPPRIFSAVRIQHSSVFGPAMGPIIFSRDLSLTDLRLMAVNLSCQYALWKLPFCGSAGLIPAVLGELEEGEARYLISSYVAQLRSAPGAHSDILTPDREMPPQLMAWASQQAPPQSRDASTAVTGKPVGLGGVDRQAIAAEFLHWLVFEVLRDGGFAVRGTRVAILGFGPNSFHIARTLENAGGRVIAVSDRSGTACDNSGLDVSSLIDHVSREHMVFGFPEAEPASLRDICGMPCEVMLLCGPESLDIQPAARFVFEAGGSMPEPPKEGTLIPTLLASFGLPFANYCEWRKNTSGAITDREVTRNLAVYIRTVWREVSGYARKYNLELRRAAEAVALSRMAEALRLTHA
jgi:glutamate dehydrogenase (NAD(P)+)